MKICNEGNSTNRNNAIPGYFMTDDIQKNRPLTKNLPFVLTKDPFLLTDSSPSLASLLPVFIYDF